MKYRLIPLFIAIVFTNTYAQVVFTDPVFPHVDDNVTVYFDATKGNKGLANFSGDVYAHTGVITTASTSGTDWKHVKYPWSTNSNDAKLTRVEANLYKLEFNIRNYYNIGSNEVVKQMAFVFRNSDGARTAREADGGDIFATVYSSNSELLTTFVSPAETQLAKTSGETIAVIAAASVNSNLKLYDNGSLIHQANGSTLEFNINVSAPGHHLVEFIAENGSTQSKSSFSYIVASSLPQADPPTGTPLGISYPDDNSALLLLFAPHKQHVFVLGDFNDWTLEPDFQMKKSMDGNYYWLHVEGLTSGKNYAFQYLVDGTIAIADPLSQLVLDPANDPSISGSSFPDMPSYPSGKANGIVSVLQAGAPSFEWMDGDFSPPGKENLVIYELLLRDFLAAHDYKTLKDTLDYFQRLGVTAIELMPVQEFEGNNSWGYNPSFHMALDKYYGSPQAFKQFINEAHKRGIAVVLDVVFNHTFGQSPLARLYWDGPNNRPAADNPWLNPIARHPFNVGYDFNHESQATKDYMDRALTHWLTTFKVDGFRFDLSKGFTQKNSNGDLGVWGQYDASRIALLKRMADKIWSVNPNAYVILEHFSDNAEERELAEYGMLLWGNMNHEYSEASMGFTSNLSWGVYKDRGMARPHLITYMESHDEERLLYKNRQFGNASPDQSYKVRDLSTALKRQELVSAFFYPIPGPKMLWQFGELGYDFSINTCENGTTLSDNCRLSPKPIRWNYQTNADRERLREVTAALIHLKTHFEAFKSTDFTTSLSASLKTIHINHSSMNVAILGNFGVELQSIAPNFQHTGVWYDYLRGDSIVVTDTNEPILLDPGEYRLLTDVRITPPQGFVTNTHDLFTPVFALTVYPNPHQSRVVIEYLLPKTGNVKVGLWDMTGRQIAVLLDEQQSAGPQQVVWNNTLVPGSYLLQLEVDGQREWKKILVH